MMSEWFDKHESYVLINRDQYQVMLDSKENPTEMWCTIGFALNSMVVLDGGKPYFIITSCERMGMGLNKYKLELG